MTDAAPAKPSRRRRRLGAILLIALVALVVSHLPVFTERLIEHGLSRFFHRPVSVDAVRFHVFPLQAEVRGLRVDGHAPDAPPFLAVPRIVAVPRLAQLLGRRLELTELRLEGPTIRIHAFAEGGDDIPRMGGGGGGGFELRIGSLAIRNGAFVLDHRRVPLDLDLPDFRGGLVRREGHLTGRLSFGPGRMQFGDAAPFPFGTEMDLVIRGSLLDVPSGRLWTERIELAYEGEIQLARRPTGTFTLRGRVDLDELDRHVMRTGFDIEGVGEWDGGFAFEGSKLEIVGDVRGVDGEFDGVPVPRYSSHVEWRDGSVRFSELRVDTLDGEGTLDIDLPAQGERSMRGEMRSVDAEGLTLLLFDVGAAGFSGRATGPFDVRWQKDRFRELSGYVTAEVEPLEDGERVPLGGRLEWRAEQGVQRIERGSFASPDSTVEMAGVIQLDRSTDLSVDLVSRDIAATDLELRNIRRALGVSDALRFGLAGRGRFSGRWLGTLHEPVFAGRFEAPSVAYLGVAWGSADWTGSVSTEQVETRVLRLERAGGALSLTGRIATGFWGETDAVDVESRFVDWPAEDFVTAFGWDLDLEGRLSGEARVRGRRSAPTGFVRIRNGSGRYYGIPFTSLEAESLLGGFDVAISRGRALVGGGELEFRGTLSDTGLWDGSASGRDVELARLDSSGLGLAGQLEGKLTLHGALERPRATGRLAASDVRFRGVPVGAVSADLRGSGAGELALRAAAPAAGLSLAGRVSAEPPYGGELRLQAAGTRLDGYVRAFGASLPESVQLRASGALSVTGPFAEPGGLEASATLSEVAVDAPGYPMRNREPVVARLEAGTVTIESFDLAGEGTDLQIGGTAQVADGRLGVVVEGSAELGFVSSVAPRLRARGTARLATLVRGTLSEPAVQGTLDLEGAALRLRGIPHGLEDVSGSLRFTEGVAQFSELTGSLGGGPVEADGRVTYGPEGLDSLEIQVRGRRISLQYPDGLRSRLDAELRVFGDAEQQWVTGGIDVRRAEWSRRYDITSELLAGAQAWEAEPSLREGVRLDVRVRAPSTLEIDNNLATLFASADLRLQGTAAAPVLVGRAEIDRGRVYFQGNTYVIRHGTIDFTNPRRTEPLFDVEAETRVRSYRVTLQLNGTLNRVVPTLTSDPPLSPIQILNLLAGADESAVASLAQAQAEQARLAAAGAATLAAGRINEEVGLERGAERLLGLNRFSIDPSVLKGDFTNPTARLTLGKRIGPDLNVQYSQDLSAAADRLFTLEYNLSDRLSLLITQAEPGGFGFDLWLRQTR